MSASGVVLYDARVRDGSRFSQIDGCRNAEPAQQNGRFRLKIRMTFVF